ncbi:MAG: MgtC/SapB family protein [Candidatus Magasanikbacteria bacterium]|nr:MgtC/SapB family protein [Candidatus Magasanikbacteria bacterium]
MQELYFLGQLALAILLGSIVGWQRERWGKSAGPRTCALVTTGATLFTILSTTAFAGPGGTATVASAVVTGIGFLGAGMILHKESRVEGLTTAAGLWAMAAVGMAVGVRYFGTAVGATVLIFLVLMLDDRRFRRRPDETEIR